MDVDSAITALAREHAGSVLAHLARYFDDLDLADECVQDALERAVSNWRSTGIPANPPGWLYAVARNRGVDRLRRRAAEHRRLTAAAPDLVAGQIVGEAAGETAAEVPLVLDEGAVADEKLRLMLLCAHPALDADAQVALTLRLVGGLSTTEVAAAFMLSEATLAQRIVRAKRKIRDARIPLRIPADLGARLDRVLAVLYLVFNEGYLSRGSAGAVRIDLVDESLRLALTLITILPQRVSPRARAETEALVALISFHRARTAARLEGEDLVLLEDQDRTRWDPADLRRGHLQLATAMSRGQPGPYQVQAAIAALHAVAPTAEQTNWRGILVLYDQLLAMTGSAVVALNRAVALAQVSGPDAGLAAVEAVTGLQGYHLWHATRAELLLRLGRAEDARAGFARAAELTANPAEVRHLGRRLRACGDG